MTTCPFGASHVEPVRFSESGSTCCAIRFAESALFQPCFHTWSIAHLIGLRTSILSSPPIIFCRGSVFDYRINY